MTQETTQGTLTCEPADEPESPFADDENDSDDRESESFDRPESCHTFADFGGAGQQTLASLESDD